MVEVTVSSVAQGALKQEVVAGSHVWFADEPTGVSNDEGPSPYDMLLAALGACTSMTIQMYAKQKQWSLGSVSVRVTYNREHVEDCQHPDEERRVHRFEREITLSGELTEDQRERLKEIAERCPVHRTLAEDKEIVTRLV
jgi:putative redox protein